MVILLDPVTCDL